MKTFVLAVLVIWGNWAYSFSIPPFTQPVIDQADMIDSRTYSVLSRELLSVYQSGGPQIGILTIPGLEEQTIEERAIQVFDEWKIGKKGKDNGVLILIAKKEKKIRIEVGYGLEGDIPDAYAKRIIEDVMLPQFRRGQFTNGIVLGVQQISHLAHVDLQKIPNLPSKRVSVATLVFWVLLIFLIWIRLVFLKARVHGFVRGPRGPYDGGWGSGGGWGGGFGGGGGSWGGGGGGFGGGGASGGW
ncbi:MAG: TPM domain-containing protein [Pseudomonadota bacterium]